MKFALVLLLVLLLWPVCSSALVNTCLDLKTQI